MALDSTLTTLDNETVRQIVREEIQLAMKKIRRRGRPASSRTKGSLDFAYRRSFSQRSRPQQISEASISLHVLST